MAMMAGSPPGGISATGGMVSPQGRARRDSENSSSVAMGASADEDAKRRVS